MRRRAALAVLALALAACGGPKLTARATETLKVAHGATNAARSAFIEWDASHQTHLVEAAPSAEAAQNAVDAYRKQRAPVMRSFAVAYSAIAAAAALVPLVEAGKRSSGELVSLVVIAADAAKHLADQIAAFKEAGP